MIIWVIWWLFDWLFDDYFLLFVFLIWSLFDDYLNYYSMIICDYLWLFDSNYVWLFEKWLFVSILWLFDDYLPFVAQEPVGRLRLGGWDAGASAACCRSRQQPFPCHSGPAYIVSNRLSASPGAMENQTQSHLKDLRRRLPRRQLCCRMIYLVPAMNTNQRLGRTLYSGFLPKACCRRLQVVVEVTGKTRKWSAAQLEGIMWTEST